MTRAIARAVCTLRIAGPYVLVGVIALLSIGTISNQIRINAANARLERNAMNGQRALIRQCALLPVGKKIYVDALRRRVITGEDYQLVLSSAVRACAAVPTGKP